jgi:hypothetical protein
VVASAPPPPPGPPQQPSSTVYQQPQLQGQGIELQQYGTPSAAQSTQVPPYPPNIPGQAVYPNEPVYPGMAPYPTTAVPAGGDLNQGYAPPQTN